MIRIWFLVVSPPVREIREPVDVLLQHVDLVGDVLLDGGDVVRSVRHLAVRVEQLLQHGLVVVQHGAGRGAHVVLVFGDVDAQIRLPLDLPPHADAGVLVRVVLGPRHRGVARAHERAHVGAGALGLAAVGRLRARRYGREAEVLAASIGTRRDRVLL